MATMKDYSMREIAEQFLELFADSRRWTKEADARDKRGRTVPPESQTAVQWCLAGAQSRMAAADKISSDERYKFSIAKKLAIQELFGSDLCETEVNDQKGLNAVRAVLRRAGGIE